MQPCAKFTAGSHAGIVREQDLQLADLVAPVILTPVEPKYKVVLAVRFNLMDVAGSITGKIPAPGTQGQYFRQTRQCRNSPRQRVVNHETLIHGGVIDIIIWAAGILIISVRIFVPCSGVNGYVFALIHLYVLHILICRALSVQTDCTVGYKLCPTLFDKSFCSLWIGITNHRIPLIQNGNGLSVFFHGWPPRIDYVCICVFLYGCLPLIHLYLTGYGQRSQASVPARIQ